MSLSLQAERTTTTHEHTYAHTHDSTGNSIYDISDAERDRLAVLAIEAKEGAYCPYSNFRVGASLLLSTGAYHSGSNVEVASTPVGICAERCAIAPVVASYKRPEMPRIRAMAVSTDIWPPASCCGMCRQFIREFCELEMKIYMYGRKKDKEFTSCEEEAHGEFVVMTIGELLPMSFGPNDMDKRDSK